MRRNFALLCLICWAGLAHAAAIEQPLADVAQEQTARAIFHELRCVVCEGQSVADSDATLAAQMRAHVRRLVAQGATEQQVLDEFRESYGEKILMTPPVESRTALLWLAPLLLLTLGGCIVWRVTRPRNGE